MERATIVPRNELHVAAVGDKRGSLNRPHLKEVEFTSTISNEDSKGGRERDMTEWKHTYIYDECRTQGEREGKEEVGGEGKGEGEGGRKGTRKKRRRRRGSMCVCTIIRHRMLNSTRT